MSTKKRGSGKGNGSSHSLGATDGAPAGPPDPSGGGKPSKMDVWMFYVDAMRPKATARGEPFGPVFRVLMDGEGRRRPVEVKEGEVVVNVAPEAVRNAIIAYSHNVMGSVASLQLTSKDVAEVYTHWAALEIPLKEDDVAPVRELSEDGYTWHRLPWDIVDRGEPTPTFDEMMARTSDSLAFMAWIGSLLDAKSGRQQYVYLHGEGGNGKGRLADFLRAVFGRSYRSEHVDGKVGQFWTSGLVGARLVVFPDFEDFGFPNKGLFKSLCGGDAIRVEPKNLGSYTAEMCCKFLFLANSKLEITGSAANRRRAIYCLMDEVPADRRMAPVEYAKLLWDEGPTWLARCKALYTAKYKATDFIETASDALEGIIDAHEEPLVDMVERWFLVSEEAETTPMQMQEIMRREGFKDTRAQRAFFAILERRYGVRKVQTRRAGSEARQRAYRGIAVLPAKLSVLLEK